MSDYVRNFVFFFLDGIIYSQTDHISIPTSYVNGYTTYPFPPPNYTNYYINEHNETPLSNLNNINTLNNLNQTWSPQKQIPQVKYHIIYIFFS